VNSNIENVCRSSVGYCTARRPAISEARMFVDVPISVNIPPNIEA
jgi:hypothetical protein